MTEPEDDDRQTHALSDVLSREPRFGLYAISAPSRSGSRTVRAYCPHCMRQEAVYVVTPSGRVTEGPGDGSKWNPEAENA